jgi:hypothetical protein
MKKLPLKKSLLYKNWGVGGASKKNRKKLV